MLHDLQSWQSPSQGPYGRHPGEMMPRPFNPHVRPPPQGPYGGWHHGEARPRFNPHSGNNLPNGKKPDGVSRMRGATTHTTYFSNPNYAQRKFQKNSGNFGNSSGPHDAEIQFMESIEITSDGPFLPQRAAANGPSMASLSKGGLREGDQGTLFESGDRSVNPGTNNTADHSSGQVARLGGSGGALPKAKKRQKQGGKNVQIPQGDAFLPVPSFEEAGPSATQPSTSYPPPQSAVPPSLKPGIAVDQVIDSEQAARLCSKLWTELDRAMKLRERALKGREHRAMQVNTQKEAMQQENKLAAALKNEASLLREQAKAERIKTEEEARKAREDKESLEQTSTDIAIQMAELKQIQRQIEKEKVALLTLKAELVSRENLLDERECALSGGKFSSGTIKTGTDAPAANLNGHLRQRVTPRVQNGTTSNKKQDWAQPPPTSTSGVERIDANISPIPQISPGREGGSGLSLAIVKAEPVAPDGTAAYDIQRRHESKSGEEERVAEEPVSAPLTNKRKYTPVGLTQKREAEDMKQPQDLTLDFPLPRKKAAVQKPESHLLGGKPLPYDFTTKRNKVSIEVALQEDAPGLLEQLQEKGLLEDMHIYGDAWTDEPSAIEETASDFGELASVIGKLWGPTAGLGKDLTMAKGQSNTGNMPRYCLACLLSLIEQTKSLRRRKWPVEWGWCRPLRAFLFVFEKHNRIVMERPEYGFATYFFELVQSLPVKWQVQRLITVMSVATTGRAALMENRQLEVGRDLTNEEAAILEDYGWNPSSGLGSLLNFCHRVVHDYNKGQDLADLGNDWKQKIGKLLMDGYDQGSIVQSFPKKLQMIPGDESIDTDRMPALYIKADPDVQSNGV